MEKYFKYDVVLFAILNTSNLNNNITVIKIIYPPGDENDPELGHGEDDEPVDEGQSWYDGDDDQPEPDEDVDLLVDDVQGKNAEAVFLLHGTGRTVVVEGALGYLGKYLGHGIGPVLGFHFWVCQDVKSVVPELVAEEEVGKVDLSEDVCEVEDLAQEEPDGVEAVGAAVKAPVPDDVVDLAFATFGGDDWFLFK